MERGPELYPCAHCGRTDPRRMIALMALWFGAYAGTPPDQGYFYLCPTCYGRMIEPHAEQIIHQLVEQHPSLHRNTPVRHYTVDLPPPSTTSGGAGAPPS